MLTVVDLTRRANQRHRSIIAVPQPPPFRSRGFFLTIIASNKAEARMAAAACLIALAIGGLTLIVLWEIFA